MKENNRNDSLKKELTDELKWYTLYASEEEYDEKAVKSLLYLLDRFDPLEEGTVPPVDEAWERFRKVAGGKELLPVEDMAEVRAGTASGQADAGPGMALKDAGMRDAAGGLRREAENGKSSENSENSGISEDSGAVGLKSDAGIADHPGTKQDAGAEGDSAAERRAVLKRPAGEKKHATGKAGKLAGVSVWHRMAVAAVLILMVLMVGNTIHVVAYPEEGFFFWMKRDDSGIQMITSPEGLDEATDKHENIYYDKDDAPDWAQDLIQIEASIENEIQNIYKLQYFDISEMDNRQYVASIYLSENSDKEIVVGIWIYVDEIFYGREEFIGYTYVQSYEVNQKQMDVYSREEMDGKVYYIVSFYEGNYKFYVRGQDNLDEMKNLAEVYWYNVKNGI